MTRSGVTGDRGLVDRRHRVEPSRVGPDAVGQVGDVEAQGTVHVDQRDIDAGVVHLTDAAPRPERGVVQVRRVDLLRVVLAVERPGQPVVGPVDSKVDVGGGPERVVRRRIQEAPCVGGCAVARPPCRLVMQCVEDLDLAQVGGRVRVTRRLVGRDEAVDVRVDDHPSLLEALGDASPPASSGNRSRSVCRAPWNSASEIVLYGDSIRSGKSSMPGASFSIVLSYAPSTRRSTISGAKIAALRRLEPRSDPGGFLVSTGLHRLQESPRPLGRQGSERAKQRDLAEERAVGDRLFGQEMHQLGRVADDPGDVAEIARHRLGGDEIGDAGHDLRVQPPADQAADPSRVVVHEGRIREGAADRLEVGDDLRIGRRPASSAARSGTPGSRARGRRASRSMTFAVDRPITPTVGCASDPDSSSPKTSITCRNRAESTAYPSPAVPNT